MKNFFLSISIYLPALFLLNLINYGYSQNSSIDSLIIKASKASGKEKALLYSDISYYTSFNDTELSLEYAQKCLSEALLTGDSLLIAEGYNALTIAHYAQSNFMEALENNRKALEIRLRLGDDYSLLSSYSKMCNCLHELGRYDEAISWCIKALNIAENNDLTRQVGLINNNIAEIFLKQKEYGKAKQYYITSIEIARSENDTLGLAKALMNLGILLKNESKPNQSDSIYQMVQELIAGKGYLDVEAGLYINLGVLYKEWGQTAKSIEYYKKAEEIYHQTGEVYGLSIVYSNLGNSFLEKGNLNEALKYYQQGLELSKRTNSLARMINAYEGVTRYYRTSGNYQMAYLNDSISDVLRDSAFSIEKSKVIEELNTRYETEKKEKQLAEQKIIMAEQEARVQRRNAQLLAVSGGIIILLLLAGIIYRNQKLKQEKLKQQVALEKAETRNRIQEEKLRISRDLHDNIGSQLTFMISSLDNLDYIKDENNRRERISGLTHFAKDTMAQLRETIWAMNSENIGMEQLSGRIAEFINHAKKAYPRINFKIESNPGTKEFSSNQAIHIYRIVQEAINNALKHAEAKNIHFIAVRNEITVVDDGKGFDRNALPAGNGLLNMEKRIQEAGFWLQIDAQPGKGTSVTITFS